MNIGLKKLENEWFTRCTKLAVSNPIKTSFTHNNTLTCLSYCGIICLDTIYNLECNSITDLSPLCGMEIKTLILDNNPIDTMDRLSQCTKLNTVSTGKVTLFKNHLSGVDISHWCSHRGIKLPEDNGYYNRC